MALLLAENTSSKNNNFNLLRLIAALLVLVSHSYSLALGEFFNDPMYNAVGMTLGTLAVNIFFVTSGFLVTGSLFNQDSVITFTLSRIRRIYPALMVAVLLSVGVIGGYFTTLSLTAFFSDSETWNYLFKNSVVLWSKLPLSLPGVFENNPLAPVVNGSLWTLPWELRMYSILAVGGVLLSVGLKRVYLKYVFIFIGIAATLVHNYFYWASLDNHFSNTFNWTRFVSFFFMGSAFYLLKDKIYLSHRLFLTCILVFAFALFFQNKVTLITLNLIIGYIVLYLAYVPKGVLQDFNKLGDYSYGIYIYAFPIQQGLVAFFPGISVWDLLLSSLTLTLFMAIFSWHVVEAPILKRKIRVQGFGSRLKSILSSARTGN